MGIKNTDEIMVNTLHSVITPSGEFSWVGVDWADLTQQCAEVFEGKLETHWTALHQYTSGLLKLLAVHAYHLDKDTGRALHVGQKAPTSLLWGQKTDTQPYPPEVTAILRLNSVPPGEYVPVRAGGTRPAARRHGRLYLPLLGSGSTDSSGMWSSTVTDALTTAWGAFLNDIQGMHVGGGGNLYPALGVLSRRSGELHQLESVAVSRLPAVQRRRQNRLLYTVSTPTTISHS